MDFLALPRRDLQALCKRNGVRANMTNAAMAEALAALPTVDGIGEYVKEPVTVPAPEVKAAAAADEQQREKLGSPLPRGRRVTVKAVQTDGGKEDEKRESAKEDAPALAVGRRGPSRRARPAPVVASSVAVPVGKAEEAEDKQGGSKEEDRRREANKEDPPAPVVGRRAASRRARPELAAESAAAGAVEEQRKQDGSPTPRGRRGAVKSSEPIRPDDCEKEEKELMREAGTDGAPALGVGRRGASRRARPAPALAEPAGKVTEEEKAPPIPRDRHVKLNDDKEDTKAATKPEGEEDAPALGVGHRGACRRVRRAPAVSGKVAAEAEPRALIPRGHGVPVKSPEVTRLDDSEDEEKEDTKPDEKDDEAPAIGVGRRGASQRAPAPADSPATRRRAATSKAEAVGVTEEAVPMRATRHRKPTMKAAAVAEEKALPKATRRKAVKKTISQQEEQENPQEAVPAPVSDVGCDNPEDPEEDSGPQKREQKQKDEDVVIIEDEILMEENPAQELLVTNQESMDHSTLQGQQVGVENCPAPSASQEDSPIMGLVSMATEQAAEKDECANFQDGKGSCGSLDKGVSDKNHDAGEEIEKLSIIQGLQASPTEDHIEEVVTDDANHESEMRNFNEVLHGTEETSEANAEDDIVSQDKEDITIDELQADLADGSVLVHCSGNIKLFVEEETNEVNTEDGVSFQEKGDVAVDMALPDTVAEAIPSGCSIDISCVEVEKAGYITSEMSESPAALDEDGEVTNLYADICHADKPSEVVIGDSVSQVTVPDSKVVQEEKVVVITDEMPWSTAAMHEDVEEDQFQTIFIHAADSLPEVKMIDYEVEEKTSMIIDEQQQSTVTIDEDVVDNHLETDVVHADEHKEAVTIDEVPESTGTDGEVLEEDKAAVITEEVPQSTGKMDEHEEEDQFQTAFVHDDQVVTADSVPDLKITGCEPIEDKTTLITDEKQQSTVTMDEDVVDDHFETDAVHADDHKKVVTADEVPELTGTDDEVVGEDKAVVTAEEVPQSTDCEEKTTLIIDEKQQSTVTMDEADVSDYSETDELKEVATDDKVPQLTGTEGEVVEEDKAVVITDEDDWKESAFTSDLPQELDVSEESKDRITPALVDDATESLSNSILTVEPAASIAADASVCKNSIEKNTTELVAMQDEKVVKVNKKSVDLYAFSLRQLKTKLKEGLNAKKNKEAKRVALARVDENVCRSHTKGQQQNLNLQQH
ncbi:hypothetical protein SEVIR_7G233700v4 [Setaria viridis]